MSTPAPSIQSTPEAELLVSAAARVTATAPVPARLLVLDGGLVRWWRCRRCVASGLDAALVTRAVVFGLIPLPNNPPALVPPPDWAPPEPAAGPDGDWPRACWSGIEYSFAAGLPGSTCTPGCRAGAAANALVGALAAIATETSKMANGSSRSDRMIAAGPWRRGES